MKKYSRYNRHKGRSRSSRKNGQGKSSLIWVWLFFGMFLGVLIAIGAYSVYMKEYPPFIAKDIKKPTQKMASKEMKVIAKNKNNHYEFYTLLPGMEVELPESSKNKDSLNKESFTSSSSPTSADKEDKNTPPQTTLQVQNLTAQQAKKLHFQPTDSKSQKKIKAAQYIIQAGIFREAHQADELKARLTLEGFQTYIQKVRSQNGQSWYRVTLGPFNSEQNALIQKKRLEKQKIKAILILQRPLS